MKQEIKIAEKEVYGNCLLYPACPTAALFAKLIGKKTFSHADLCTIEALGYTITTVSSVFVTNN